MINFVSTGDPATFHFVFRGYTFYLRFGKAYSREKSSDIVRVWHSWKSIPSGDIGVELPKGPLAKFSFSLLYNLGEDRLYSFSSLRVRKPVELPPDFNVYFTGSDFFLELDSSLKEFMNDPRLVAERRRSSKLDLLVFWKDRVRSVESKIRDNEVERGVLLQNWEEALKKVAEFEKTLGVKRTV